MFKSFIRGAGGSRVGSPSRPAESSLRHLQRCKYPLEPAYPHPALANRATGLLWPLIGLLLLKHEQRRDPVIMFTRELLPLAPQELPECFMVYTKVLAYPHIGAYVFSVGAEVSKVFFVTFAG